jgi:hypothetical protein
VKEKDGCVETKVDRHGQKHVIWGASHKKLAYYWHCNAGAGKIFFGEGCFLRLHFSTAQGKIFAIKAAEFENEQDLTYNSTWCICWDF